MNSDEESFTPSLSSEDEEEFLPLPAKRAASKILKSAPPKASKSAPSKAPKTKGCSKKRLSNDDDDEECYLNNLIVVEAKAKVEDATPLTNEDKLKILEGFVDKFMKEYVVLQEGETEAKAREVMTILVAHGFMIIDHDFGERDTFIKSLESTIKKGLFSKVTNGNTLRRSKWFGSAFGNIKHNLGIVRETPMLMSFIEKMLGTTGGVVANFFAQYYQPSITGKFFGLHGHLAYHQDKFFTHYRLLTTFGDSKFGKKMTFTICDGTPSKTNPGKSVTINLPHGRTVLLTRYVGGVSSTKSNIWHKVFNCENTVTLCFEVFH